MSTKPDSDIQVVRWRNEDLNGKNHDPAQGEETTSIPISVSLTQDHNTQKDGHTTNPPPLSTLPSQGAETVEQRLRESEARYRSLISATTQIVWTTDPTGHRAGDLSAWCAYTGQTLEEADGPGVMNAIHPDERPHVEHIWYQAVNTHQTYEAEYRLRRHDGVYRVFNSRAVPVFDADGAVREWVGINTDITERKQLEAYLHQSEMRFQLMFEQAGIGMVFASLPEGHLLQANQCFCDMVGYSREELLNRPALYITHPDDSKRTAEALLQLVHGVQSCTFEKRYIHKNDSIVWVNITMSAIRETLDTMPYYLAVIEDITERKRIQQETAILEHRTHIALEGLLSMAEALIQLPENTNDMRIIGKQLAELTCDVLDCQRVGILTIEPETEMVRPIGVAGLSPEQELEWWREQEQQAASLKENPMPELIARLRNKEVLTIDMTQPPFRDAPNPYSIKVMLIAPMYIHDQLTGLLTLDYGIHTHIYTENEVSLASAVAKLLALVVERQRLLTERAEARGREVALREANSRMEEFLGVASHELRTPLTTIKANVQLAKKRLHTILADGDTSPSLVARIATTQDMLIRAERQTSVLNRLVGDLIDISRIQTGKLQVHLRQEPSNLTEVITETVEEQRKASPHRSITLSFSTEAAQHPLFVMADQDRIAQVLTNYLSNALKYSSPEKPVDVSLTLMEQNGQADQTQTAQMVRVSVHDQGPGLPPEEQSRIWECFYQSDGVKVISGSGVGLGLGLYISQTIIARHNGQVGVDSTPGNGSTFWFTLPIAPTRSEE